MSSDKEQQDIPRPAKSNFNLREQIERYTKYWYWFVISVLIFGTLAFLYIRYTIPQYNVSSTVLISQDENISESELSAFKDLGLLDDTQSKLENEIHIMKSRTLITNVVKNLGLNISYFADGRILEVENYPKSIVEINFLSADSIIETKSDVFRVLITSESTFSFVDERRQKLSDHSFGKTITTKSGDIVITPSVEDIKEHKGKIIEIRLEPVRYVAEGYRNRIAIFPVGKNSSIVGLSLNDPVKEKAKDILNNLIEEYNKTTIENKKVTSERTANFINERLSFISGDLSEVDNEAAGYKSKYGLGTDVASQAQMAADIDSRNMQQISQLNTQLNLIESMRSFVQSQEARNDAIPGNLGFDDSNISGIISRYNSLIFQKQRLLKSSSEQNPVVVNIDQQLNNLRQVLLSSLNSLRGTINIQLNSLKTQDKYFSGKLYSAPIRQKDLREIEREQTIKEQLYLYLLQKREEAEITSNITVSNAVVIDKASTLSSYPVSPNKKMIYLGAGFFGLVIPFMIIYLRDLFNIRVSSREDLEKYLSMPIIGSIPRTRLKDKKIDIKKAKNKIIVSRTNRSSMAEAFRILRTNLDFLLAGSKKDPSLGKIIFVTSTISGEGKTLISSNLAKTLSISGKKVIYVGTDLRDPKFHEILDMPRGKETEGFTNYILNSGLKPADVIYTQDDEDPFDFLPSGAIPPNPAEMLMHDRVKQMFDELQQYYDYIIVDTAPVSLVTDTLLIGDYADLVIYIVREGYSDKRVLQVPETFYRDKRLPNMAVLLNSAGDKTNYNYGYGYGYGKA